ncbi:MAG: aminotransferase class V-fold PLP-dependent enzyme, partial [Actinomycetota bacterium]
HLEFPTNLYPWMNLSSRGVEFRRVDLIDGRVTPESVFELMDDRTRVVALSLVQFWNGYRLDVDTIGVECRRRGALLVLDAVQGVGALRIDVSAQPIDALAAGTSKWLLGGPGAGFAWIRPDLIERLDPPLIGTRSTTKPQEYFEPELNLWSTGRRFEESDLNWPLVASFLGGAELLAEVGIGPIEERVLENSERLSTGLSGLGFEILEPWPRTRSESSGIVSFRSPGEDPEELMRYLDESRVKAQLRRDFIRFSPHFYNNREDVDGVLDLMASRPVRSAAGR